MGPLVPDVIGNELNYIVAIFVGIAFGFVLEQAGFSSSKKLVGLFYGYDFTVLRVFFTGGLVAMIGVIILAHYGLLDMSLVYINPTFLWSAIVGGLIMGLGFVVGGFCPGTSVCAAAIGKIDAMIFIVGSFLGVLIFAEGYPVWEPLYKSANWGNVRIFDTMGMSQAAFATLLTVMAMGAFWAVRLVENKVNKITDYNVFNNKKYIWLTGFACLLGVAAFLLPDRKEVLMNEATLVPSSHLQEMEITSDELAFRIIDKERDLFIYDLRSQKDFEKISLPNSTRITLQSLFEKDTQKLLGVSKRMNVFISDNESEACKAAYVAQRLGFKGVSYLKGGFTQFNKDIITYSETQPTDNTVSIDTRRFRADALKAFVEIIKESKAKSANSGNKASKRVLGGC